MSTNISNFSIMIDSALVAKWTAPEVLVAVYAAIVSTISLFWLIISKKRKMRVEYEHCQAESDVLSLGPILSLIATNVGNENLHIKDVEINFCGKKIEIMGQMKDAITNITPEKVRYPHLLQKGNVFRIDMLVRKYVRDIQDKLTKNDKLRFIISDTLGRKYKSSKFKYETLLTQYAFYSLR